MTVLPQQFWSGGIKGSLLTQVVQMGVSLPKLGKVPDPFSLAI